MQLMQAWNMRMTVADSRNYREIVETLAVASCAYMCVCFMASWVCHMLVTLLQIHPDTPGHPCGGRQKRHPDRRHRMNLDKPREETSQTASHIEILTLPSLRHHAPRRPSRCRECVARPGSCLSPTTTLYNHGAGSAIGVGHVEVETGVAISPQTPPTQAGPATRGHPCKAHA